MLSRSGVDASNSLQRSKSAASVKERRKHPLTAGSIDPDIAKVHALIAAHRAFDGSRERTSTSLTQSESSISQRSHASPAFHLQRQRSTLQTRVPKLANTLQVPGAQGVKNSRSDSFSCTTEFGSQNETYGAEPSSYRRLRSSRSSLTPLRQSRRPEVVTSETPFSQARTLRSAASTMTLRSPGFRLRLKRSINRLRPERQDRDRNLTAPVHLQSNRSPHEDAIMLARSQYYQELNQPSVSGESSFSLSNRARKAQKAFRESCRYTAGQEHVIAEQQSSEGNSVSTQLEKRSLSATLADKVKKVLKGSRSNASIPPQHLDATRTHFGAGFQEISTEAGFDSYLEPNQELDGHETFQTSTDSCSRTLGDVKRFAQGLRKSGSEGSIASASRSRITSWSNSTATNSIATRPSVCDPKRLSIIKEDGGPHQPSSSAGRHIGGVTVFQQPLNVPEGQVINSQRVYSALMRRIEEEQEEMDRTQAALKEIHDAQAQDEIVGHYLFSAPTIRRVESKPAIPPTGVREADQSSSDEALPLQQNEMKAFPVRDSSEPGRQKVFPLQPECQSRFYPFSDEIGPNISSPFREILNKRRYGESKNVSHESEIASDTETRSVVINPPRYDHDKPFIANRFGHSTDSLYSRTTSGGTNADYMFPIGSTEDFG